MKLTRYKRFNLLEAYVRYTASNKLMAQDPYDALDPLAINVKRLLYAILERAIIDSIGRSKIFRRESLAWIRAETEPKPFNFTYVCQELDLEPEVLRHIIIYKIPKMNLDTKNQRRGAKAGVSLIFGDNHEAFELKCRA